ncbi:MAG: CDP-alcohol phosphatidyltransferase family protein [Candidatus Coatesbacteria bacterium]|nr:CDP-alcohol phosphatidyltransferase family protein [Candidatus Coatesbacteria bacterium]
MKSKAKADTNSSKELNVFKYFKEYYFMSLKEPDAEEIFDLYLYRPLGLIVALIAKGLPVTPNHISIISMALGLFSGYLLAKGSFILAALILILANMFDCADGQLARIKHNGTTIGRIIDGAIDYVVYTAIYVGIAINLYNTDAIGIWAFVITFIAGVMTAVQSATLDYQRHRYLAALKGTDYGDASVENLHREYLTLKKNRKSFFKRSLFRIYLIYTSIQKRFSRTESTYIISRKNETWRKIFTDKQRIFLKFWTFMGSSTHLTVLVLLLFFNEVKLYLELVIVAGTIYWSLLILIQYLRIDRKMKQNESRE